MFFFQKLTNKKNKNSNQKDSSVNQSSEENNKTQNSKKIQLPLKKTLFPAFYQNQPTIQNIYQDAIKLLQRLQDMIEQTSRDQYFYQEENVKKYWKETDQALQKLESSQLGFQIQLIFFQYISQALKFQSKSLEFISDELQFFKKERYVLIQFFIQWQLKYCKQYTDECFLSLHRGIIFLKSQIDQINSSFEVCCFLNFYSEDILIPLGYKDDGIKDNKKILIENEIQELKIISLLETVLFIYNLQLYLPTQLINKHYSHNMQQDQNKYDSMGNIVHKKQSLVQNDKISDQFLHMNQKYQQTLEINQGKVILKYQKSDSITQDQNFFYQAQDGQCSSTEDEHQDDTHLNQSFDYEENQMVQPLTYVLWQEYEIVRRFSNYIKFVQFFIGEMISFNLKEECLSNISENSSSKQLAAYDQQNDILKAQILVKCYFYIEENQKCQLINLLIKVLDNIKNDLNYHKLKHLAQLIIYLIASDEVGSDHKKIIFSSKLILNILNHFEFSEQKNFLSNQYNLQNEFMQKYHPLLDFQQCVIKNGKTKKININPKSKMSFNIDIYEKLSIINLSLGILNKDIKLSIKYLGPFNQIENFNPIELIMTNKISQTPYRINFLAEQEGIYSIEFVNSYSWFASKDIEYRINVLTPFQVSQNQSLSLTKRIFPVASRPFHQKAVEQFQENYKVFNQTSDQALLVFNQNILSILFKSNNKQKGGKIIEIFQSLDNQNIFDTLEPQVVSSLSNTINQIYKEDPKKFFNLNSNNKLVLYVVVENEEQKEYFNQNSLFQLSISHNFPQSQILVETYPNIFIQSFLMKQEIFFKQKIILYWQFNNNLYKSNNYESAQLLENNFDEVYQISYDQLQKNQILIITKSKFEQANSLNKISSVKNEFQKYNFIMEINTLFK